MLARQARSGVSNSICKSVIKYNTVIENQDMAHLLQLNCLIFHAATFQQTFRALNGLDCNRGIFTVTFFAYPGYHSTLLAFNTARATIHRLTKLTKRQTRKNGTVTARNPRMKYYTLQERYALWYHNISCKILKSNAVWQFLYIQTL